MVNGTNGNGHIDLKRQTSDATATGQSTALFANSNGDLKWKYSGTTYTTLQTRQTADRVYSFQNKSYTLGDSADVAGKLNIADTSDMLFKYLRRSDTTSMLSKYLRKTDTSSLSNRINLKVNISDTSSMLNPYLRKVDTTNKFVNRLQRIAGKDSIIFYVGNTRYAIKDSTGGGGGSAAGSNGLIQFNLNGSFGADSSLFWDNTNKRLGVGITTPLVKLDVRQGIKDDMPRNYEIANFTKKGDTKLGVYTADTYASGSGSSISLGNSKNLNADGYYPGFEFQNVNDSASNTGYVRYNFVEKGIDGNVALAAVNLFTINSNGTVQINPTGYGLSPVPRLVIGEDNMGASLETSGDAAIVGKLGSYGARQKRITYKNSDDDGTSYTVQPDDHIIIYATNSESTITLPAYPENGRELVIKHAGDYTSKNLIIDANSHDFSDVDAQVVIISLDQQPNAITIVYYDGIWFLLTGQIEAY